MTKMNWDKAKRIHRGEEREASDRRWSALVKKAKKEMNAKPPPTDNISPRSGSFELSRTSQDNRRSHHGKGKYRPTCVACGKRTEFIRVTDGLLPNGAMNQP
jgi:hypothetical protein